MPTRSKTAWMLLVEGPLLLALGGWLVGTTVFGGGAAAWANGPCTGALAAVLVPVLDLLGIAIGVVVALLGVAGLAGGCNALRHPATGATRWLLLAYAVPWGLVAFVACVGAAAPQNDLALCLAAAALAATLGLVHVVAARPAAATAAT